MTPIALRWLLIGSLLMAADVGATEIEAEVNAIRACAKTGHKECHVLFKDCSRPNGFDRP